MLNVLKMAARNLMRYQRRTLLTSLLIVIGIVGVLLFISITGSFKSVMIAQFTDSVLGDLEVHHRGYVASIDNLPLDLNMSAPATAKVEDALDHDPAVAAYSPRVKLPAMFSNFTATTSIRLNGIEPAKEDATCPLLRERLLAGPKPGQPLLRPGQILLPVLLARGMKVKVGDTVVLVATNQDGSVNGKTFVVGGILDSLSGPGGRDGYIDIRDARELLRMTQPEVNEIAVRLKDPTQVDAAAAVLKKDFAGMTGPDGKPLLEVHTWTDLSPFASLARMIDVMTLFIKITLVAVVLVSVMNVMVMAVYERIREIGAIAAIGTPPSRILAMFLSEGLLLGVGGAAIGTLISLAVIYALNVWKLHFAFGQQQNIVLAPWIGAGDVAVIAGIVVLVAVAASLQPAWKAARMDPIGALRHV
jgi:putative ABC transport system permease protein